MGDRETLADREEEEEGDAGLEVMDEEDKESSQGPEEEESSAALPTTRKRSRDSCGLADLLGETYASDEYRTLKDHLKSKICFSFPPCKIMFEPHCV